jgi:hypothetical protein
MWFHLWRERTLLPDDDRHHSFGIEHRRSSM